MPAKKKARAREVQLYVGTRKGAFIFRSDRWRKSWKFDGPHFPGWERGSAEFRFAETLWFVLRESRRLAVAALGSSAQGGSKETVRRSVTRASRP